MREHHENEKNIVAKIFDSETGKVDVTLDGTVKLTLTQGNVSRFIETLKLGKMARYEYVHDFQAALYAPRSLKSAAAVK